jgi:hypothetical protein
MTALIPALINMLVSGIRRRGGGGGGGYGGGGGGRPEKSAADKDAEYWYKASLNPTDEFAANRGKTKSNAPSWDNAQKPFAR